MKLSTQNLLSSILMTLFFILLCGFQSTFWFQTFGQVPSPLLWLLVIVYLLITRENIQALFFCYFLTFIASRFSSISFSLLLLVVSILSGLIMLVRSRIYWQSSSYYILISLGSIFAFHVLYLLCSLFLEGNHASLQLIDRLTQFILTLGFCYPLYICLDRIDHFFGPQDSIISGDQ